MAATRLIALHINKGKTVAQCLRERTDYAQNPEKTAKGDLVTGYQCDPMTVDEEFLLSKRQYQHITGKHQKHEVIAYQIRQSFKPGEITPEEANQVGYELAERFTKGKHAFQNMGVSKLPKVKELSEEYATVLEQKKSLYAQYRLSREEMREYQKALHNTEVFFDMDRIGKKDARTQSEVDQKDRSAK